MGYVDSGCSESKEKRFGKNKTLKMKVFRGMKVHFLILITVISNKNQNA